MGITMDGKYQTRDGRAVRILCVDGPGESYPVVGVIKGQIHTDSWTADGIMSKCNAFPMDNLDLVPIPPKHEGWVVMEMTSPQSDIRVVADGSLFESKKDAQFYIDYMYAFGAMPVYVAWED